MSGRTRRKRRRHTPSASPPSHVSDLSRLEEDAPLWRHVVAEPFAVGLAVFIFFRPWRDGMTFLSINFYFVFFVLILSAIWLALAVRTSRMVRTSPLVTHRVPALLLLTYLTIAFLSALDTVQYDATYRALLFLSGHVALFLLCCNTLRSERAIGIVLGAFVLTTLANDIWSIIHLQYILPLMREQLSANPDIAYQYFRMREVPLELQHRLEMNRAFGTFLHPNALAAFLVLGIPYLFGELGRTIPQWIAARSSMKKASKVDQESPRPERKPTWIAAVLIGILCSGVARIFYPYLLKIIARDEVWRDNIALNWIFFVLLPTIAGLCVFLLPRRFGTHFTRLSVQMILLASTFLLQLYVLATTFSRGGMLALIIASTIGVALFLAGSERLRPKLPVLLRGTACVLIALSLGVMGASGWAQAKPDEIMPREVVPMTTDQMNVPGVDVDVQHLMSASTLKLRLTYWRVGLTMALDNFWTGVGPGNFGTAYAKYQYQGAGGVQAAHNVLVQTFAETGLFGLAAFCAFWGYFFVWGALRIVRERYGSARCVLTGLYTGVLAFFLHSLVDFNFVNAALGSLTYAMAALFYVRANLLATNAATDTQHPHAISWKIALPLLIVVALLLGATIRVYLLDLALTGGNLKQKVLNVGNRRIVADRIDVARFLLRDIQQTPVDPQNPPFRWLSDIELIIPNQDTARRLGEIRVYVPEHPGHPRPLGTDETPPEQSLLIIRDTAQAEAIARDRSEEIATRLALVDRIYPHVPEVSVWMNQWYQLLYETTSDPAEKLRYADASVEWTQRGVERSPYQAWYRSWHARALWIRAQRVRWPGSLTDYELGLEEYAEACKLYSSVPGGWNQYGDALQKLGQALVNTGHDVKKGERLIRESEAAYAEARKRVPVP